MDVWEGLKEPEICHAFAEPMRCGAIGARGIAMTSRIHFRDVIKAIHENAFIESE